MINQKGQSLVELATFGTILLFCLAMLLQYGMQANYQQNLQMQAFRKTMKAAYYKSGPAAAVSLSMTKDKAIPDPRDSWGFGERRPIGAGASVTWDSNVQALYIDDYSEEPEQSDLPRSIIEINNTLGLSDSDLADGAINNISSAQGAFKTAEYGQSGCSGSIMVVLENPPAIREASREEYREEIVSCGDIRVKDRKTKEEEPGKKYAFIRIDGLVHTVTSADIDHDDEVETIIAVEGTQACDEKGYCGRVSGFKYVDFQNGEIDTERTIVYPWEVNKCGADINCQQGLLNSNTVVKTDNNSLVKTETPANLSTTTDVRGNQNITHTIRFNNGSTQDYPTNFGPARGNFTWSVSK